MICQPEWENRVAKMAADQFDPGLTEEHGVSVVQGQGGEGLAHDGQKHLRSTMRAAQYLGPAEFDGQFGRSSATELVDARRGGPPPGWRPGGERAFSLPGGLRPGPLSVGDGRGNLRRNRQRASLMDALDVFGGGHGNAGGDFGFGTSAIWGFGSGIARFDGWPGPGRRRQAGCQRR